MAVIQRAMIAASGPQNTLLAIAAVCGVCAASLRWRISYESRRQQDDRRHWFDSKWEKIRASRWLSLPEIVVRWLVTIARRPAKSAASFVAGIFTIALCPPLLGIVLWIHANLVGSPAKGGPLILELGFLGYLFSLGGGGESSIAISVLGLIYLLATFVGASVLGHLDSAHRLALSMSFLAFVALAAMLTVPVVSRKDRPIRVTWWSKLGLLATAAGHAFGFAVWIDVLTRLRPTAAVVFSLLGLPIAVGMAGSFPFLMAHLTDPAVSVAQIQPIAKNRLTSLVQVLSWPLALSVGISFTVTLLALAIGHAFDVGDPSRTTARLLWSNAFFDGLTVLVTLGVLARAARSRALSAIPLHLLLCIVLGAVFACASLWVGVADLSVVHVGRVLVGRRSDGATWDFGAYFWALHTVFLPILCVLLLIALCWLGKLLLTFEEWFFEKARREDVNGLNMTSALLTLIGAIAGSLGLVLKLAF